MKKMIKNIRKYYIDDSASSYFFILSFLYNISIHSQIGKPSGRLELFQQRHACNHQKR